MTTTFENKEEANKIIEILLEERLVSCCQLSHIESSYQWKGKIEQKKIPMKLEEIIIYFYKAQIRIYLHEILIFSFFSELQKIPSKITKSSFC